MTVPRTLCFLVLMCFLAVCRAAEPMPPAQGRISAEGTDGFRALLAQSGLTPIGSVEQFRAILAKNGGPQQCLLIWFRGADRFGEPLPDGMDLLEFDWRADFVERGGALWVATDQPFPGPLRRSLAADVFDTVILARRNAPRYSNRIECPYAYGLPDVTPNLFQARSSRGQAGDLREPPPLAVATNRPSYLISARDFTTVGVFRRNEWRYLSNISEIRDLPFAQVMAHDSGGRILLLSDHSVFINSMLLPREPNDNLAFTLNCVEWLTSAPGGNRRQFVLFVENGHVWQPRDYDLMLRALPSPTPENVAQFLWENRHLLWENLDLAEDVLARLEEDRVLAEVESQDLLGQLFLDLVPPPAWRRALFIVGAVLLGLIGGVAWLRSRNRGAAKSPCLATALENAHRRNTVCDDARPVSTSPLPLSMLGRALAREFLARLQARPEPTPDLSRIRIDAGWRQRREIRRHLARVRGVAFAHETEPTSPEDFRALTGSIEFLTEWVDRGVVSTRQSN